MVGTHINISFAKAANNAEERKHHWLRKGTLQNVLRGCWMRTLNVILEDQVMLPASNFLFIQNSHDGIRLKNCKFEVYKPKRKAQSPTVHMR